jgi:hypothetical protein
VNKIFLDKVLFHCANPQLHKVADLNTIEVENNMDEQESIFKDAIVFNPNEVRQYLFLVQPKEVSLKLSKFE